MNSSTSSTPAPVPIPIPPPAEVAKKGLPTPVIPPPKLARLPEGALPSEKPDNPPTQAENRLRFWARQNGYAVKVVHTHRLPDMNTYFAILEGPKE